MSLVALTLRDEVGISHKELTLSSGAHSHIVNLTSGDMMLTLDLSPDVCARLRHALASDVIDDLRLHEAATRAMDEAVTTYQKQAHEQTFATSACAECHLDFADDVIDQDGRCDFCQAQEESA